MAGSKRDELSGSLETWLVTAGRDLRPGAPLNVPPVPASNFFLGTERHYARDDGTPSWEALEAIVGGLEGGQAVAFASGMAAISAAFEPLATGSLIALGDDCYQAVVGLAERGERLGRWRVRRLPVDDTAAWVAACAESDLIWLESPSNPLLTVADVAAICAAPRKRGALLCVDNTLATPLNQRPLELGADVSVHSATKYIGGHSDLLSGVVSVKDPQLHAAFRHARMLAGSTPGVLESYLAVRGARTLALRLERAQANALRLAHWLSAQRTVARVRYPGLATHPTHAIARQQLRGFGAVISFDLHGGAAAAERVCAAVRLIRHATSLGGVESTIERRAGVAGQEHLPPSLLRLSVGIESADDIEADLEHALAASLAP